MGTERVPLFVTPVPLELCPWASGFDAAQDRGPQGSGPPIQGIPAAPWSAWLRRTQFCGWLGPLPPHQGANLLRGWITGLAWEDPESGRGDSSHPTLGTRLVSGSAHRRGWDSGRPGIRARLCHLLP